MHKFHISLGDNAQTSHHTRDSVHKLHIISGDSVHKLDIPLGDSTQTSHHNGRLSAQTSHHWEESQFLYTTISTNFNIAMGRLSRFHTLPGQQPICLTDKRKNSKIIVLRSGVDHQPQQHGVAFLAHPRKARSITENIYPTKNNSSKQ